MEVRGIRVKMFTFLAAVMTAVSLGQEPDTLFYDDFTTPGIHDWQMGGYWSYGGTDNIGMAWSGSTNMGALLECTDTLVSPPIYVPLETDSLELVVEVLIDAYAVAFGGGGMHTHEETYVIPNYSDSLEIWDYYQSNDYILDVYYQDTVYVSIPWEYSAPDDSVELLFTGEIHCQPFGYDATASFQYRLYSVTLLGSRATALGRSTWGSIKASL